MSHTPLYIKAATQISIQEPLSEQWMDHPLHYDQSLTYSIDPSYKGVIPPNEARRMSKVMRRAIMTAIKVMEDTGIKQPEAIVTGTNFGCLSRTEVFLDAIADGDYQVLSPTAFMQSTHNTVGSTLSIYTFNHGYNNTYSHGMMSFDLALHDAWMQMQLGDIQTALVGGYEEMVDSCFEKLKRVDFVGGKGMVTCGEIAMSMMVGKDGQPSDLCEIAGIEIFNGSAASVVARHLQHLLEESGVALTDISAVMTGVNGNPVNDQPYSHIADSHLSGIPRIGYKHIFGENYTSSAMGVYAAAQCLKKGTLPQIIFGAAKPSECASPNNILIMNHFQGEEFSFILLKKNPIKQNP